MKHKKGSGYYRYAYNEPGITADEMEPWIELNIKSLSKNLEIVSRQVKHKPILAVVKCNAYGHGLIEISRVLIEKGIRHLAVVKPREAFTLRENNIQTMILNLGTFSALEAAELVKQNISQSVFTHRVALLSEAAVMLRKKAKVHIKLDTGLGRVGVPLEEAASYIRYVAELPGISIEGIFTVLTYFDRVPQQIRQFTLLCEKMEAEGISPGIRHAAASGDVADGPESAYLDMVRPGNCLYGMSTFSGLDLEPVLSLKVRIGRIEKEANRLTAYLPIGLADGYPTDKTGKMEVLVKGKRCPVIGTEHSFTTIDITGQPTARPGDAVILVGTDGDERITLEELSRHSGQSAYRTPVYLSPDIPGETIE
ncbi:MAG: alanine racemase [bacterium]|nr:alanine racemase [bacterium]